MVSNLPQEFRKYQRNRNQLRHIFEETQRTLELIKLENFFPGGNYSCFLYLKFKSINYKRAINLNYINTSCREHY